MTQQFRFVLGWFMVLSSVGWAVADAHSVPAKQSAVKAVVKPKPLVAIQQWRTSSGVGVWFVARDDLPMLDVAVVYNAGSAFDGKRYGLAALTHAMLRQGVVGMTHRQLDNRLSSVGAELGGRIRRDQASLTLRTLTHTKPFAVAWPILLKVVHQPNFRRQRLKVIKSDTIAALLRQKEQPMMLAQKAFFKSLYRGHPYGHARLGQLDTVKAIKRKHLLDFFKQYYVRENAIIVMVGAVTIARAKRLAEQLSGAMPGGHAAASLPRPQPSHKAQRINIPFASQQTSVVLGQLAIDKHYPDMAALQLGNHVLGGGMDSELFDHVREQRGWVYFVHSYFFPLERLGPFIVMLQTQHPHPDEVVGLVRQVIRQFIQSGPSPAQLVRAKAQFLGGFFRQLVTNRGVMAAVINIAFYGRPTDYLDRFLRRIQQVKIADVQRVFAKILPPNQAVLVRVGPQQST